MLGFNNLSNLLILIPILLVANLIFIKFIKNRIVNEFMIGILSILLLIVIYKIDLIFYQSGEKFFYYRISEINSGLNISFRLEKFSLTFINLIGVLQFFALIYTIQYLRYDHYDPKNPFKYKKFYTFYISSVYATFGVALSANLLTIFIFYEAITILTYPLIVYNNNAQSRQIGRYYLTIFMVTSVMLLIPAMSLTYYLAHSLDFKTYGIINQENTSQNMANFILLLFVFGIAKTAIIPLHRWLPHAMVAPTPVSALLHAVVVVKSGLFTLMMVIYGIFDFRFLKESSFKIFHENWLTYLALTTIVVSSIIAFYQDNLKKRLAYSTISQLSYVIIAISLYTQGGLVAAMLQMIAHAVAKITLFFVAGIIYVKHHRTKISDMSGIAQYNPIITTCFLIALFSIVGLPPTIGFFSKYTIISNNFSAHNLISIITIIFTTIISVSYIFPVIYTMLFSRKIYNNYDDDKKNPYMMMFATIATTIMTVLLFFYAKHIMLFLNS
jgi:formate hydrogenlyase subunit 3/multisubunit Na+/H+ antiporter MnhD subunit